MTNLKEIMQIAEKGCFDSYETIDGIVTELCNRQMGEIFDQVRPENKDMFNIVTQLHDLSESKLDQLTFMDFVCLLIDTENRMKELVPDSKTSPEQMEMLLANVFKRCLLDAGKTDLLIREFLGINVYSFMHYLEGKHNDHEVSYLYSELLQDSNKGFLKDADKLLKKEMNIGDYLENTLDTEKSIWKCWTDIKEYEQIITTANAMDRKLLLDSLSLGFRERMNVDDLLERYSVQDDLQIDEWIFDDDFYEGGEKDGENN